MFDFPANPSIGQPFVASGITYIFDGIAWNVSAAPNTAVLTAQARNRVVNPCMAVSQENGSTAGATDGYYMADQWMGSFALPGTVQFQRSASTGPNLSSFLTVNILTASATPAAGSYLHVIQRIEGSNLRDFMWGTASARQAMLRFSCFTTTPGTYTVAVKNGISDRTFLAAFTVTTANTWTTQTIVVPGDTTGTWATDTSAGMVIGFGLTAGTNYQGVAGWQAGNKIQIAGATNFAAANGNQFLVTDVGLYLDPLATGVAPPFQMPAYDDDLRACKRYWQKMQLMGSTGYSSPAGTATHAVGTAPVEPRATPTLSATTLGASNFPNVVGSMVNQGGVPPGNCYEYRVSSAIGSGWFISALTMNARM